MTNTVYIATSLDGYIADKDGGLDWLYSIPNPDNDDCGWAEFLERMDAIVMGRNTFETVCGFDCDWPYPIPVFVLSNSLESVPEEYQGKAQVISGELTEIIEEIHQKGYKNLYIDGGKVIQSFLQEDLIDEMIITTLPILLGGGTPLFGELEKSMHFELVKSEVLLGQMVKNQYKLS